MELTSFLWGSFVTLVLIGVLYLIWWVKTHHGLIKDLKDRFLSLEQRMEDAHEWIHKRMDSVRDELIGGQERIHSRIESTEKEIHDRITGEIAHVENKIEGELGNVSAVMEKSEYQAKKELNNIYSENRG